MTSHQGSRKFGARKASWLIPLSLLALSALHACSRPVTAAKTEVSCPEADLLNLTLQTEMGNIVAAIRPNAAPGAIAQAIALANAPPSGERSYENTVFGYVHPHVEIRMTGAPADRLPAELDAHALGLDTKLIQPEDAYAVLRWEVLELYTAYKKNKEALHPDIVDWATRWRQTNQSDLLAGVSRQRVNEALGYRYQADLKSMPVEEGSMVLIPAENQNETTLNLGIILDKQLARRTGKWVAIGTVTEGLEVARQISLGERFKDRDRRRIPIRPVTITHTAVSCAEEEQ